MVSEQRWDGSEWDEDDLADVEYEPPTRLSAARMWLWRARRDLATLWRERNATAVAAVVTAHRSVMMDEPRLRAMIDRQLMVDLRRTPLPLRWRLIDARWRLTNAVRLLAGRERLPQPYEERIDITVSNEDPDLFQRDMVAFRAERRRIDHVRG